MSTDGFSPRGNGVAGRDNKDILLGKFAGRYLLRLMMCIWAIIMFCYFVTELVVYNGVENYNYHLGLTLLVTIFSFFFSIVVSFIIAYTIVVLTKLGDVHMKKVVKKSG